MEKITPKPINRGRQKIEIKRIEKESKRQVTFSKRRKGLFKKAADLSRLSGAQIAILTFSLNGKAYSFSTSQHLDTITDCFLSGRKLPVSCFSGEGDDDVAEGDWLWWWDQPVEDNEIEECLDSMKDLRENVQRRIQEMGDFATAVAVADAVKTENVKHYEDSHDVVHRHNDDGMEFIEWDSLL